MVRVVGDQHVRSDTAQINDSVNVGTVESCWQYERDWCRRTICTAPRARSLYVALSLASLFDLLLPFVLFSPVRDADCLSPCLLGSLCQCVQHRCHRVS